MSLAFVPLTVTELVSWAESGVLPGVHPAFSASPAMAVAFGLDDAEEAEYTALCVASVAALLAGGPRIVVVAEAGVLPDSGDAFGATQVSDLSWAKVSAVFADDAEGVAATRTARELVRGLSLPQAWVHPGVEDLVAEHDLLWHGRSEWGLVAQH